jgi:hypothetical protein
MAKNWGMFPNPQPVFPKGLTTTPAHSVDSEPQRSFSMPVKKA